MNTSKAQPSETSSRRATAAAIAGLCFGTAVIALDGGIATVALPTIARDLQIEKSQAVLVVTIYQLVFVVCVLPFAAIGDRIGLRRWYRGGQIVFVATSILALFADTLTELIAVRALHAAGGAACLSVNAAMIRSLYRPENLGKGLGLNTIIVSASTALAPLLGGILLANAHWSWLFAAAAPFALASLALGRLLPDPPPRVAKFDVAGGLLTAATLAAFVIGMELATHGPTGLGLVLLGTGIASAVVLVRHERRVERPVLPVDLLAIRIVAISALAGMTVFVAQMTLLISLPFRLEREFGLSPAQVGLVIAAWPLTTIIVAPSAGLLSDRVHSGILGAVGMTIATAGLLLLAFVPTGAGVVDLAWRVSLCGLGFALFMTPNARLIVGFAPKARAASAGGLVSTIRLTGQTGGATLVAAMLAIGIGEGAAPQFIAAGLTVFAGVCSVLRIGTPMRRIGETDAAEAANDV